MRAKSLVTENTLSTITPAEAEAKIAPVVALLEVPLLELRKSLGSNTSADPDAEVVAALTSATNATTATEDPHRLGLYALESTETAAPATPALRQTATEVSAAADRGQKLSTLLGQAHSTQATAAAKVDAIIADFRAKAKAAAPAVNGNNLDAIVELAEEAIQEAVGVVGSASTEMDQYTRNTKELTSDLGGTNGVTVPQGATEVAPGVYVLGTGGTSTDTIDTDTTTTDPATAAQIALQEALIDGGVALGTAAIDAGVTFGTHLIDKIAEVAMHGIDKGAELATTGIDTLAANVTGTEGTATSPATTTPSPTTPSTSGGGNSGGLFAGLGNGDTAAKPEPANNNGNKPASPAPASQAPAVEQPQQQAPATTPSTPTAPAPAQQPVQSGVIPPSARPQQDQETEKPSAAPRHGQPGVVPATA
ncbi:hypothetical protein [Nocardia rhizosphaerihabitans]|uniref:Uncharacterized protein n=1 Tax=Nocardia rhizosphaerihabitans TaxID=1691570 RepID=A0ABQ2KJG2_9NOCA|nr:hypothetical protein [Nocardia rhizosphaerihabitans]GGN84775.1 hypothetical protein GCM10011610_38420 [Nocardia rhizosphaerihabitans]